MPLRFNFFFILIIFFGCKNNNFQINQDLDSSIHSLIEKSKNKKLDYSHRIRLLDSALLKVKEYDLDSLELSILSFKSDVNYNYGYKDSSLFYDRLLLKKARDIQSDFYQGKANMNIALYFYKLQISDSAFYRYNLSKYHFLRLNNRSQVGRRLMSMGLIQQNQSDYFGSKETLAEALQFLIPQKDSKYVSSCYSALATNHRKLLNYSDAIKYYNHAISTTNSEKDKLIYQNNLAATYVDNKQYDDAILLFQNIALDSILKKNKKEYARVLDNLAYAQWVSGNTNIEEVFLKPLQLRKQNNDKRGQIASYTHLGEFYSRNNQKKASSYFDSVIQLSKVLKMPRAEKDALKFLMKLKPKNVVLRDRYVFLQDSLYEKELKVKTQFAKYKYDDKVKQEENLRLEKESAKNELEANQQRTEKIYYLIGFLFTASVLGLSFYGFKQRTRRLKQKGKAEKLEAIHETEAQLSRKLHDDHGGKLNQAMLLVQRDVDKSVILDKLESVYNQTRNFSREINAVDTGANYWESLKSTLEYTKPTDVAMTLNGGKELDWSLISHQTKTVLYKVLQELVINMGRHSKAKQAVILFKDKGKELFVYYEDDGVGVSKEALLRKNGLYNTEKRIQAISGSITFDSEEGKGFRAEIRIPK